MRLVARSSPGRLVSGDFRYARPARRLSVAVTPYVGVTAWPGMSMTFTGDGWLGIPANGQPITMRSLDFWRVEDTPNGLKIRENWVLVDLLAVWDQFGVDVLGRMRERVSRYSHGWPICRQYSRVLDLLQPVTRTVPTRSHERSTVEVHAGEQVTVGDAGGGEEAVVTLDEVVDGEDAVEVVALVDGLLAFAIVAGPQASELLASHAPIGPRACHRCR